MITNIILLFELALVVITTVHHASARRSICERLIHETELFENIGRKSGLLNFRHAFENLTIHKIQDTINKLDDFSDEPISSKKKSLQERLAIAYFLELLNGILLYSSDEELGFSIPYKWCTDFVAEHFRLFGNLNSQRGKCLRYIFGVLCTQQDCNNGKKAILQTVYENWSDADLKARINHLSILHDPNIELPGTFTQTYTLGYFNHVGAYINHPRHSSYSLRFKSINKFCADQGNAIVYEVDDEYLL